MAAWKGYRRGLIVAIFSLFAIIIGLAAAVKFSVIVSVWLQNATHISKQWLPFLSFLLVMIGVIILVRWLANLLQASVEIMLMGWLNKLGGILLYMILYTAVYSIILFYGSKMGVINSSATDHSKCYPYLKNIGPETVDFIGYLLPFFKGMFQKLEAFFASFASPAGKPIAALLK
jgi:membrane protein required for colicin V production